MKGISRNLLNGLSLICVVALIVFVIQLIAQNSNSEPRDTTSVVTEAPSFGDGDADGNDPDGQGGIINDGFVPSPTDRPPPQGTRYNLPIDPSTGASLVVYAQPDKFTFSDSETDWRFEYRGGGDVALIISFHALVSDSGGDDAIAFLNRQIGEETASFKGLFHIGESDIEALSATAQKDGTTYEAWLYRLPPVDNLNLALAFFISYEFNSQRDDFYEVFNSMSIITEEG